MLRAVMPPTLPPPVEMLRELVALPSVSSPDPRFDQPNRPVIDRLAEWAEAVGLRARIDALEPGGSKANLVATSGAGDGGLILSGHTDTVPFDEGAWEGDPFVLTADGDRLVGLGAADMKGFFAAALEAVRRLGPGQLSRPLTLVATADEESGMAGGRALAEAGELKAAAAVIGEPTSLRPVRAHKGIAMAALRLRGRSGHSSDPSLGISALEGMYDGMDEILRFRSELQGRHRDDRFQVPFPTMNLGSVEGGDSPNRICAACELRFDLRSLPGMDADEVLERLSERLGARLDGSGLGVELRPLVDSIPAFETAADALIVQAAEEITGEPAQAVLFATEGPYFHALGIDTVVLGPGDIAVAHQPNEHVHGAQLERAVGVYGALIERFCGRAAS
jgi:acetylornithine deacetylase